MRSSRAAILPFPGDPFLLRYWLSLFPRWADEIDTLYIYLNSTLEAPMVDYIRSLCLKYPKVNLQYNPVQIEHGEAIDRTLDIVSEEYVMLVEDDGIIFTSGVVDHCFRLLEAGKEIVGSKRGSCSLEISEAAKKKWNLSYEGYGDQGPNFWPNFFFCRRSLLLKTDRNFGARAWKLGETIEPLGCVVEVPVVAGDTFVNASLQLRNLVPEEKISYMPQYHGHPDDLVHYLDHQFLFDGKAMWCHIGSLSTGVGGCLTDDYGRALARRSIDPCRENDILPGKPNTDMEKKEWERRVQWWLTFYETAQGDASKNMKVFDFWTEYGKAIDRIIRQFVLDKKAIKERQRIYTTIGLP